MVGFAELRFNSDPAT